MVFSGTFFGFAARPDRIDPPERTCLPGSSDADSVKATLAKAIATTTMPLRFLSRSASNTIVPECDPTIAVDTSTPPPEVFDIKGDQFSSKNDERSVINLNSTDMIALGLTTAIGGHYFAWNVGLSIGFGGFLIVLFLVSTAYCSLVLCLAELSSALPFAGGAYGVARVTLGIFPGYLVAVCDSFKSIIYASAAAYSIGQMVSRANDGVTLIEEHRVYEFAHWAGFYIFCLSIHLYGRKFFWQVNLALAALSVVILFIYIFGSIRFVEFEKNASYPGEEGIGRWFHGGMYEFISVLPLGTRFFQGLQSINLACGHIKNPKTEVPKGYIWSMLFVMVTSFSVFFLATAVKPGLLIFIARLRPLSSGFKQIFGVDHYHAAIASIPPTVVSGFGFMYRYGQQMSAMGKSGLLNPVFGKELAGRDSPYVSLLVGSALGYGLCIVQWYYPDMQHQLYSLSILGATTTFLSIFASFVVFRRNFPTIQREFVSPLGLGGALYGFLVFLLCFISVCAFQEDFLALIMYAGILVVASVYYYFVVQKRQVFSEEEKTVMFKAYVVKGNAAKADRIRRGTKAKDKKYIMSEAHSEAPSATLSTKPSSSPYVLQLQQQKLKPHHTLVRWGVEISHQDNSHEHQYENGRDLLSNEDVNENESEDENIKHVAPNTGGVSPLESHAEEELENVSPMPPILLEDLEVSNRVSMQSPKDSQQVGTQFCDLV